MIKNETICKSILVIFFIFSCISIYYSLKANTFFFNPYSFQGWFISYTGQGFKYVLAGELTNVIRRLFSVSWLNSYLILLSFFYIVILGTLFYKFWKFSNDLKIVLLFAPTSLIYLIFEDTLVGRFEVILFFYVSLLYLFIRKQIINNFTKFYFINGLIISILLFVESSFIFYTPMIFIMLEKFTKRKFILKKFLINSSTFYIPQLLIFFFILFTAPTAGNFDLELYYNKIDIGFVHEFRNMCNNYGAGYICFLNKELADYNPYANYPLNQLIRSALLTLLIFGIFLIYYFYLQEFNLDTYDFLILVFFVFFCFISIYATDWPRYLYVICVIMTFFINETKTKEINSFLLMFIILLNMQLLLTPSYNGQFTHTAHERIHIIYTQIMQKNPTH